jgi:phosphoglycolate phosphatase-like HAD superfamily hydrolase
MVELSERGLISFDIDGTLEFGEPPGIITVATALLAKEMGFVIGSCSDRPVSTQTLLWQQAGVEVDFTVVKQHLLVVRETFSVANYLHIGDTEVDRRMAAEAGFHFIHVEDLTHEMSWLLDYASMCLGAQEL